MTYFLLQSGAMFLAAFFIGCWCGCFIRSAMRSREADYVPALAPAPAPRAPLPAPAPVMRVPEPAPPIAPPRPVPTAAPVTPPRPQAPVAATPAPGTRVAPEVVAAATAVAAAQALRPSVQVDDLKRIKGIGPELEMKLNEASIRRYAEIASWTPADVARVNRMIGQDGRIQHENWVEQAQILARGEETAFSRRMDRREVADGRSETWTPTAPSEVARQAASAAQTMARPVVEPVRAPVPPVAASVAPAIAVGAAAAAAAAIAASTTASARQATAPLPPATQTPPVAPPRPAVPPIVVTPVGTSPISMRPAPGQGNLRRFVRLAAPEGKPDSISLISGVGEKVAGELNRYGIYHYWQLAAMGPDDIEYLESRLGLKGRIRREEWQEQARELMAGKPPRGLLDRARAGQTVETAPVAPPTPAPVQAAAPAPTPVAKPAPVAPPPAAPVQVAPVVQTPPPVAKPLPVKADDLGLISGVADKLAGELNGVGIVSFAQLAALKSDEVDQLESRLGLRGRIRREEWQEQARELMAGKPPRGALDRARAAQITQETARPASPATPPPAIVATQQSPARTPATPQPAPAPAPVQAAAPPPPRPVVQTPSAVVPAVPVQKAPEAPVSQPAPVAPPIVTGVAAAAAAAGAAIVGATAAVVAAKPVVPAASAPAPIPPAPVQAAPATPAVTDPASSDPNWQPRSRASNTAARGPRNDLKRIKGIGVVIDKKLEAMGITTYEQIAAWTTADIDKVSNALDFKGRIEREQWVQQARILSGGGQTDFSRRMDRGDGVV